MSQENWMAFELKRAKAEVEGWSEWKREAMRKEVMNVSSGSATRSHEQVATTVSKVSSSVTRGSDK